MKAVFVQTNCVLRDSQIDPDSTPDSWRLMPATLEAMRLLAGADRLVFLYGVSSEPDGTDSDPGLATLVKQVEAAGGRVDGLISCRHGTEDSCKCWGEFPGICWVAASQFDLRLDECYVLADMQRDVKMAYAAGSRPSIVLCGRSVGEVLGSLPSHKDFPIATDLTRAVSYIGVEEEISQHLGHPRNVACVLRPQDGVLYAEPEALPQVTVTSSLAQSLQARMRRSRLQLRDAARWLSFLVAGAVGLSLGIAYMLTHLYRVQRFPQFVYFLTLQFIPRPLRGALFIAFGVGVIVLAVRSLYGSINIGLWRKPRA